MFRRVSRIGAVGAGIVVALAGTSAAAVATPRFPSQSNSGGSTLQRRPAIIYLTPTDGALIAGPKSLNNHIHWSAWGARSATGEAEIYVDPCGCAADSDRPSGSFTLTLSDPRRIDGYLVFSKMTYSHIEATPAQRRLIGPTVIRITYDEVWMF